MKPADNKLTKADTRALWHAVQGFRELVCAMRSEGFSADVTEAERATVLAANRALRKVNAIRKAQSGRRISRLKDNDDQPAH